MAQPSLLMIYFALFLLAVIAAGGLYILMELHKPTRYTYIGFKIFFIILFTLWIHKYLYEKFTKMIGIKEDVDTDEENNDDSFNLNLINNIFS